MGCATSKLDDSPALALCRERCFFLDVALRQRFTLAQAHVAYLNSLKAVGLSIDRFFNQDSDAFAHAPPSPVRNLPARRKGDPSPSEPPASPPEKIQHHLPSPSDSDSHLHFLSDDDDGSGSDFLHHLDLSSPVYQHHLPYGGYFPDYGNPGAGGGGFMNISYMKNQATPSVVYNQRPINPENVQMGESSSYYPYPIYSNGNYQQNPNPPYPIHNSNNNYNGYFNYSIYGGGGGAFGGSSLPQAAYGGGFSSPSAAASSSKAPPPPPSPPSSSAWDFLNPFESYEKNYPPYAPSRDSRELREEEGIPDLEDEDDEVVKEVHGNQKFIDSGRSSYSKSGSSEEDAPVMNDVELQYRAGPSVGTESGPVEYEVHVVDKKVVGAKEKSKDGGNAAAFRPRRGFSGDSEVVREIKVQFERASDSGNELTKFLEFGRRPYKRKHGGRHVSTKILHLPSVSSLPSTSKRSDGDDPASLEIHQELELRSKTLSSTLHKLYLWEKKLCEEVKVEEKMRILHEQKSTKLKQLDERGAEAHKLDTARALVRSLSTKIRIAIQVVDKISVKINSLRDEDLWPQLNEFIQGLTRMWESVLECHHNQCQAIGEAKRLDAVAFQKYFSDARFEATRQLEYDLINWTQSFSDWIGAQKSYVQALNNWLTKCLLYVPEETADGVVPFSPGRIGAPPVFVVCNQWWQSLDRVSEREVVDSMLNFTSDVLQLWNRDKAEMRQRMLVNKDERKIKSLDKEDQKMQKEFQALHKRMVLIFEDNVMPLTRRVQSETTKGGNLQASLQHVLEAIERFAAVSLKVYKDLLQRIEEDHLAGKQENVL